ncbi:hypothetical protein M6B38_255495 [Iris pallida]|uniref:Uncharacterized protein n=1 Tax=Iris pallida TaxID=29817 RepID=A0AAX6IH33_IRIPA|nr:hypothetical protein M6B38_255495 [Iris pallida]
MYHQGRSCLQQFRRLSCCPSVFNYPFFCQASFVDEKQEKCLTNRHEDSCMNRMPSGGPLYAQPLHHSDGIPPTGGPPRGTSFARQSPPPPRSE